LTSKPAAAAPHNHQPQIAARQGKKENTAA